MKVNTLPMLFLLGCFFIQNIKAQTLQEVEAWINSTFNHCSDINSGQLAGKKLTTSVGEGTTLCVEPGNEMYKDGRTWGSFDKQEVYYSFFAISGGNMAIVHGGQPADEDIDERFEIYISQENAIIFSYSIFSVSSNPNFKSKYVSFEFLADGHLKKLRVNAGDLDNKEYDFTKPIIGNVLAEINTVLAEIPDLPLLNKKGKASNGIFGIGTYLRVTLVQIGILQANAGDLGKVASGQLTLSERFPAIWK